MIFDKLTNDIMQEFRLPKLCRNFIRTRIIWAYAIGYDYGRSRLTPKRKAVVQLTKTGEFIKEWGSGTEVSRALHLDTGHIAGCCKKRKNYKSAGGYKWEYAKDYYKRMQKEKEDIITRILETKN